MHGLLFADLGSSVALLSGEAAAASISSSSQVRPAVAGGAGAKLLCESKVRKPWATGEALLWWCWKKLALVLSCSGCACASWT
eukprot:7225567-Karenia_brevis.AAC.1